MIRTFLLLHPAVNSLEPLVEYYREQGVIEAAIPYGLVLGELVHPCVGAASVAVGSLWTDAAAYESWVAAPEREALIRGMATFLDDRRPPTGWAEERTDTSDVDIDFVPVFANQPLTLRHRAGQPSNLRHT